jgi:hypothetical protein
MLMVHEWKRTEKKFYLPGTKPELISTPAFRFFSVVTQEFAEEIIKLTKKKKPHPLLENVTFKYVRRGQLYTDDVYRKL